MSEVAGRPYAQLPLRRFINDITDGPFGSSLTSSHYSDDGARVIRLGNIGSARFRDRDAAYIPLDYFIEMRRHEVKPGDLLIAGLGDLNHPVGRACIAPPGIDPAIVKADCFRARLDESRLTHRYAAWALSSQVVAQQVSTLSRGSTRARINLEVTREIRLPVPPIEEQRRIADFLDTETGRIDALVTKRGEQLRLLKERRVGCLAACVSSHGLDSYRHPLAGHISSQWPVVPLRRVVPAVNVGVVINPSTYFSETGVPFIHGFNVRSGWINPQGMKFLSVASNEALSRSQVHAGDVLVVRAGAPGRSAVVTAEYDGSNCASVLILRRGQRILPEFLSAFINSPAGRGQVQIAQYGAAQEVISAAQTLSFQIPVPDLAEQRNRVTYLKQTLAALDRTSQKVKHQSYLLAERRQALITAAVTGQFDVSTASGRNVTDGVHA